MASGDSRPVVLMETAEWNQREPYNLQCPMIGQRNCLTGCVPTAYAIVMLSQYAPSHLCCPVFGNKIRHYSLRYHNHSKHRNNKNTLHSITIFCFQTVKIRFLP